jgi:site-specific DNA-methyltransferase (adenine-specific)
MNLTDKITVTNEDNMELMARYPDNYFDLAIVDPPYGINFAKTHTGNGWTVRESKDWDKSIPEPEYFKELFRVSKNQIIWGANYMTEYLPPSMGWLFWDKGQRNFSLADGELAYTSFQKALRVFELPRGRAKAQDDKTGGKIHPTQKPVQLYEWMLDNNAKEGDKILDTHLGSGSIAIACHNRGFELTACELDEEYFNNFIKRFKQVTAQQSLF